MPIEATTELQHNARALISTYLDELPKQAALVRTMNDLQTALGQNPSERTSELYANLLLGIPAYKLVDALTAALCTTEKWLTPKQIVELYVETGEDNQWHIEANQAWASVLNYRRDHDVSGEPEGGDRQSASVAMSLPELTEVIERTLSVIGDGWPIDGLRRINASEDIALPGIERDFIETHIRHIKERDAPTQHTT